MTEETRIQISKVLQQFRLSNDEGELWARARATAG